MQLNHLYFFMVLTLGCFSQQVRGADVVILDKEFQELLNLVN